MRRLRAWLARFAGLFGKSRREREFAEELENHLQLHIEDNLRAGMSREEARRQALIKLGGLEQAKENYRDRRGLPFLDTFFQDLRFGVRMLRKSHGFMIVAVLSLALGIGANSAIFSVINALMYRPLPYPHPDRLVVIWQTERERPESLRPPPIAELMDWKKQDHVFEDIALWGGTGPGTAAGIGEPEIIRVQVATPGLFAVLGARPILGRIFLAKEMQDTTQTILISCPFWKSHFNGDPKVLGRSFTIDGIVSTVVGVMPPGFAPFWGERIDVWEPIDPESPRYAQRIDHWLMPVGRLKPGVTIAEAQSEMDVIARRLEQAYPASNKGIGKKVVPLHQDLFGGAGRFLYPLLGVVGFVLLIGCLNVASLLQTRAESRRKEFALRASIGASRGRLVQQLLVESGILALLGGCFGVGLTFVCIRLFLKLAGEFPDAEQITVDGRVLLFTLGISILTVAVFGLVPAIQASRPNLDRALREGDRRTGGGSRSRTRHVLVISEVALAMVLLVGAGLMVNTMLRLQRVDPGFDPTNVLTMSILLPEGGKYMERVNGDFEKALPAVETFHRELLEKIPRIPGIELMGIVSGVPTHWTEWRTFSILGHPAPARDKRSETGYDEASPGYFLTLRIPLKKGRYLDEHDTKGMPWVLVVNEAFAQRYFPNQDPIGQQIVMRTSYNLDEERPRQIVGVVGNIKQFGLASTPFPLAYASYFQQPDTFAGGTFETHRQSDIVIRTASNLHAQEAALVAAVKKVIAEIDPDQPVTQVMTMNKILQESTGSQQFYLQFLGIFAGVALGLAIIGIYGVMSHYVADRTHEIGVRVALGAQRSDVRGLVVRQGLRLAVIGVALGIAGAVGLTRFLAQALYGVKPTDLITFLAVSLVLVSVALLACYIPARRATNVDPMVALRYE